MAHICQIGHKVQQILFAPIQSFNCQADVWVFSTPLTTIVNTKETQANVPFPKEAPGKRQNVAKLWFGATKGQDRMYFPQSKHQSTGTLRTGHSHRNGLRTRNPEKRPLSSGNLQAKIPAKGRNHNGAHSFLHTCTGVTWGAMLPGVLAVRRHEKKTCARTWSKCKSASVIGWWYWKARTSAGFYPTYTWS